VGRVYESWDLLTEELKKIRTGRRLVFTNGCFDLLHVGHVRYLQEARRQGDHLIVGVNTDASVRVLKGDSRPVQNERDRCEILAALGCVDSVTLFSEDTPLNLISAIRPDFLVNGGDYRPDQIVGASLVMSYGGEVRSLQFIPGVSTSSIISKLLT
jgi:rfaE bifunctional protein nucleotidyltransferase chain/domain